MGRGPRTDEATRAVLGPGASALHSLDSRW